MRQPDSTSYLGSFAPAEQFATLVAAEARRRGVEHICQLVLVGDGAPWIWNYHAREHLHDLAARIAPVLGDQRDDWLIARLGDLDAGDIETLVTETLCLSW